PTPTPTVTPTPTPTPTPTSNPGGKCTASLKVLNSWPGGYQASVTVKAGNAMISSWTTAFTLPSGSAIQSGWSGTYSTSGSTVTVSNAAWNGLLGAGATAEYGFVANGTVPTGTVTVTCA
ncbi:cellulose binding domain-containing protein, partial [Cellulomonas chitinilytica]|uniref:cellulose binding domain-containing protein n=1 Tax=Cellulomonas chitinilytica TaxID=398759 RepID=UPI001942D103